MGPGSLQPVWWSSHSLPAQGHIRPFLQFSKSLAAEYDVDITFSPKLHTWTEADVRCRS
jgi:hypothetical protein